MNKKRLTMMDWIIKSGMNMLGLFLLAIGVVLGLQCGLGASPFDVLQVGMTKYLPITIGQASIIIALIFLVYTWSNGVIPGLGTILNAIFVGVFIDLVFTFGIQVPNDIFMKVIMLVSSTVLAGIGIVLSLKAKIGVGTRDAFMEYMVTKTQKPVGKVRSTIEIIAFILGVILVGAEGLGSTYGIGTIFIALTIGHVITFTANVLKYDFDISNHYTFKDSIDAYKANKLKGEEIK
ncbi:MAG: YczE/YyaS/YitT family protein [Peptostreptococcaceae bacterium]